MIEAVGVVAPEAGPAAKLEALLQSGSEAEIEKHVFELIEETKKEVKAGLKLGDIELIIDGKPYPARYLVRGAEQVRDWSLLQIGKAWQDEEKYKAHWERAFAEARAGSPEEKVKAIVEAGGSTSLLDYPLDFPTELIGVAAPKPKPQSEKWPEAPLPPPGATELERLAYPRGLLGHVVQYIVDTDRLPDRQMALAGAMVACHKALDRKIIGPGEISVILFLALLAETGAGKNHILNCIRILLRAMGVENAIAGTGIASKQSIDEILEGPLGKPQLGLPSALITIDEYGSFLTRISSKGMTGNISEIPAKLQTLWGWHPQAEYLGDIKVGKAEERVPVYGPAFSISGVSTDRSFFRALKEKQVSGGFVNRHFVINAGRGQPIARRPKYSFLQCPEWLLKALREVAGEPAEIDNRPLASGAWVVKDFRRIDWGAGVEERCFAFENENRALPMVEDREVWARAHEIALRLATVHAVFRGRDAVELDDLEWGIALARHSTSQLAEGMSKHMQEEFAAAELCDFIREKFKVSILKPMSKATGPGVLTRGAIHKVCERKCDDHRKIGHAMDQLMKCGDIVALHPPGGPGQPTDRWKWTR